MRTRLVFGLVVLQAMFVIPAFGQNGPTPPPDKTVTAFGQTIHYWDVGSGPVVVLVHGMGSRKEDWLNVVAPLSQKHRLLIPDQIGFGQSDKPPLDYSIQTFVDFLNEFLHELKIEKASLVGESLGGWISGLYAVELSSGGHLVPVEKLVLVDAGGLKQDKPIPWTDLNPSSLAAERRLLEEYVFSDTSWLTDDIVRRVFTEKLATHDAYTVHSISNNPMLASERLDGKLAKLRVPTLVIWGRQDALLPIASGERYAAEIPGARLVSFDKCGHVPSAEKPEEFASTVIAFLDGAVSPAH